MRIVRQLARAALYPIRLVPQSPMKEYLKAGLVSISFRPPEFTLINDGETVVQVGVAAPSTVHRYSRAVGPRGRAILIEASPANVAMIREAMRSAPWPNVTLVPMGAWNEKSELELSLSPHAADNKFAIHGIVHDNDFRPENSYAEKAKVAVDRVDAILEELGIDRVDYISITVNGAEVAVLQGCEKLLRQPGVRVWVKAHALKTNGEPLNIDIARMLSERGLQTYKTARSRAVGNNPAWKYRDGDVYAFRA